MADAARLFYTAVWRNWLVLKRYTLNFVVGILSGLLFGIGMLLFSLAFDEGVLAEAMGSTNWLSFMTLGLAFQTWQGVALWHTANMFREELGSGQIDYTFTCPMGRYAYIISNVGAQALIDTFGFLPMFLVGLWYTRDTVTAGGLALGLLATAISVGSLAQMGVVFAGLVLRYRQVTAVFSLFNFAFQMLTGMFVPLQVLPPGLALFGMILLPQSFGMDLLRHYVMGTRTIIAVPYEWAVLVAQLVVLGVVAKLTIRRLERTARDQGLHYL